jgi:Fe2+ transport system protein FeoA
MNTSFEQITIKKTLSELYPDESGIVTKLRGDAAILAYFRSLGIVLDAPINRVQSPDTLPVDTDVYFVIGDRQFSLNEKLAKNIRVSVERVRSSVDVNRMMERRLLSPLSLVR